MENKNKKILIFSLAYDPLWGGAEIAVKEITNRLPEWEFNMVTLNFGGKEKSHEKIGNINVHRINTPKLLFPFVAWLKARKLHKKNNYKIVWSIMANRAGFAGLFFKLNFPKVKFLLTLQEGDPFSYPKKRANFIYIQVYSIGYYFNRHYFGGGFYFHFFLPNLLNNCLLLEYNLLV